jgi:hypothetical protein
MLCQKICIFANFDGNFPQIAIFSPGIESRRPKPGLASTSGADFGSKNILPCAENENENEAGAGH